MMRPTQILFARAAESPAMAGKIAQINLGEHVKFEQVTPAAQPFLVAMLCHHLHVTDRNVWVVCQTEREQEKFHAELSNWMPDAMIFPYQEKAAVEGALPDPETSAERLGVLQRLGSRAGGGVVVLNSASFAEPVPAMNAVQKNGVTLRPRMHLAREQFVENLSASGYEMVAQVADRGQFAVRGGIMDIYSWQHVLPIRVEWFDDDIESVREFELDQQTSIRSLDASTVLLKEPSENRSTLRGYHKKHDLVFAVGESEEDVSAEIHANASVNMHSVEENFATAFFASPLAVDPHTARSPELHEVAKRRINDQIALWHSDGYQIGIHVQKRSDQNASESLLSVFTKNPELKVYLEDNSIEGFVYPAARIAVTSGAELLAYDSQSANRPATGQRSWRGLLKQRTQIDFTEFAENDLVVHLEHGLARFRGLQTRTSSSVGHLEDKSAVEELMVLEFANSAKLFVPLEQAFLVSRYVGLGKRGIALSTLGDGKWSTAKKSAEKSIYDYAGKLLKLQASRETHPGFVFAPDNEWQKEFENAFPYRETDDQVKAIDDTKHDMESGRPMDRLICGDVGFGKTEVAIRAAFKAAMSGKQVAMMVPTTVLAQQHYENFSARMANFPVTVELMSRYRTRAEQDRVAAGLRDGSVDIVIGTHRLISKDISFKDLGILVVDEEQRFGVRHKERIKERFPNVDVLTLSATPIPRTLYMALTGARDLSTLETPPPSRYPVETSICAFDERVIRTAIDRELNRQGQIYFLHNRVEDIEKVGARIRHLCPRARVDLGHGQMEEGELEQVMHRFVHGETDVLVATTIIESGLDIPNANTIIIDRADRFGLADLYQLRGRVGRGQHKAYAYLMLPRDLLTVGEARKRINAIKQYSTLGAGFKIALRDLEIRGAGNILGLAQSGHLTAVGFDLYCQLLRQAVSKLKGEKVRDRLEVVAHLDFASGNEAEYRGLVSAGGAKDGPKAWPAFLPADYVQEPKLRIQAYRALAGIARPDEIEALRANWRDRFGRLPKPVENLLELARLKLLAATRRVQQIEVRGDKLMLTRHGDYVLVGGRFPRLTSSDPVTKVRQIRGLIESL